ncbi:MAG: hypothetical protein Q4D27_09505 [Coriobacteriia bacterium]|nr:hypothetical protein [Coriobacteriia bacterium]
MTFPDAYAGVKKLYAGEIFQLIGSILLAIAIFLGVGAMSAESAGVLSEEAAGGMAIGVLATFVPSLLFVLIGEILVFVGLHQAGKDEPRYMKKAFWAAILMIVVTVVIGVLIGDGGEQNLGVSFLGCLIEIFSLFVFLYSIRGVMELAKQLGNTKLVSRGKAITVILIVGIAASAVASIAASTMQSVASAAAAVSLVALALMYILYLSYLSKAKRMLVKR